MKMTDKYLFPFQCKHVNLLGKVWAAAYHLIQRALHGADRVVRHRVVVVARVLRWKLLHQLFHRVYKKMSDTLAPLNEEIQRITGYPELAEKDAT